MSATTADAIKAVIEGAGLGISAFRDVGTEAANADLHRIFKGFITVTEGVSIVPSSINTPSDSLGPKVLRELVQVSLWQAWRNPADGTRVESPTLPGDLLKALDGGRLTTSPTLTWALRVRSSRRILERAQNIVQHATTVEAIRNA